MKKTLFIIIVIVTGSIRAQLDVYVDPLMYLFNEAEVSAEYGVSDYFGVELDFISLFGTSETAKVMNVSEPEQSGLSFRLAGKYYLSPDNGADGLYLGLYGRYTSVSYTYKGLGEIYNNDTSYTYAGLMLGRKWVWDSGLLVEFGIGVGQKLSLSRTYLINAEREEEPSSGDFDGLLRLSIGYRFNL